MIKPEGITDSEWAQILAVARRRQLEQYKRMAEQVEYARISRAHDERREAFVRFCRTLGFDWREDALFHADFSRFRSDLGSLT